MHVTEWDAVGLRGLLREEANGQQNKRAMKAANRDFVDVGDSSDALILRNLLK